MGEKARPDFRRIYRAAQDRVGFALAGCAEVSKSRCAGEDAFPWVLGGGGEIIDLAQSKRNWMRHNECGLRGLGRLCSASPRSGSGVVSPGESFGFKRSPGRGRVSDGGADQAGRWIG